MHDPIDPRLPKDLPEGVGSRSGPDSDGRDMLRSILVLAILVGAGLAALWLAGA